MNYIGSKYKLIAFLFEKISMRLWGNLLGVIFYDLFAGTGIVGCA
ncbi:DNA adenine methylase [Helicobacter pylori]|nr:DNA adenine methylase [Helicobacter pylori]